MSIECTVTVNDENFAGNMESFNQWLNYYVQLALEQNAQQIAYRARQLAPVRTGRLMQNIYSQAVSTWVVKIFCSVPYALFQELGTRYIQARLFLTRALQECAPNLFSLLQLAVQNAAVDARSS
ncbi:MAG: hypothetical protein ABSB10_00530 [Candidatus Bathyarchaeia archaeon]|jgi:HK97 gp10 family phage protein